MNGVKQFLWISIFLLWNIILLSFFIFFIFLEPLKSKSTQMLRPQKGNLGVSFNNTLLNFGLYNFRVYTVQVYRVYNNIIIIIVHTFMHIAQSVHAVYSEPMKMCVQVYNVHIIQSTLLI